MKIKSFKPLEVEFAAARLKRIGEITCLILLLCVISLNFSQAVDENKPRILLRNATLIITMDPKLGKGPLGVINNGDVLFDGNSIIAVGKNLSDLNASVLDTTGKIVLPGFVDVHNHLWQSVIRGCGTDKDLPGWLDECVFPMGDGVISESDAYALVRLSTLDLISTGVTTVVDWSHGFTPEFVTGNIRALSDSGLRFIYAYFGSKQTVDTMIRIKKQLIDPNPMGSFQVASQPAMAMLSDLSAMSSLARNLNVPLNVHLLEDIKQREERPIEALKQANAFGAKLLVNHAIHLTDEEIEVLAKNDVRVAHNPLSNMRLAAGIIQLSKLHAAGIKIGLGLDGGTNDTSDMFANMRAAVGLQRAKMLRPDVFPTVIDVIRMATIGGAEVLDMENKIGSITPGKKADLIILDPSNINFAPRWDWINQIVFNGQPSNIEYVFVNGRPLKIRGKLVGISHIEIIQAAEEAVHRIKEKIQKKQK